MNQINGANWLAPIKEALFEKARIFPNAFVWWDASSEHPLSEHLQERPQDHVISLAHPDFKQHPKFAPLLVQLTGAHDPLLDASAELAAAQAADTTLRLRQIGGWIFSSFDQKKLADRLSARLTIRHPQGKARLRLHDPRAIAQLALILSEEQISFLASVDGPWCYVDEGLELRAIPCPAPAYKVTQLRADEVQWEALQRVEAVNEIVRVLRSMGLAYRSSWLGDAHRHLRRARDRNYSNLQDQVAYAVHGLWLHPEFDCHPAVSNALKIAESEGLGFCMAMSHFGEAELSGIVKDLNR